MGIKENIIDVLETSNYGKEVDRKFRSELNDIFKSNSHHLHNDAKFVSAIYLEMKKRALCIDGFEENDLTPMYEYVLLGANGIEALHLRHEDPHFLHNLIQELLECVDSHEFKVLDSEIKDYFRKEVTSYKSDNLYNVFGAILRIFSKDPRVLTDTLEGLILISLREVGVKLACILGRYAVATQELGCEVALEYLLHVLYSDADPVLLDHIVDLSLHMEQMDTIKVNKDMNSLYSKYGDVEPELLKNINDHVESLLRGY